MAAFAAASIGAGVAGFPTPALAQLPSPACSSTTKDFANQALSWCNFAGQDLTNAKFSGATLTGVVFIRAKLTGANFENAVFADSQNPVLPTDFTLADLTSAIFRAAKFQGLTYFTYATLTGADFSHTDLSSNNAIFGEAPLTFDRNGARPIFQATHMSCEFIGDWKSLDLRGANVTACSTQLAGRDFSGILLGCIDPKNTSTCVNLSRMALGGANFSNGNLTGIDLTAAHLAKANFFQTKLYGAHFNNANLDGATLKNAVLSDGGITQSPAKLTGAFLRNVNLAGADLQQASFDRVNFYGTITTPAGFTCGEDPNHPNFTLSCASASGATLTGTSFSGAYLYGVDFGASTTRLQGTKFDGAVLVGANMSGATFIADAGGIDADYSAAFIQGATFPDTLNGSNFQDAFVDFIADGNTLTLRLDGSHTTFAGYWGTAGASACVATSYGGPTQVPGRNATLTCPDGTVARDNAPPGCGLTTGRPPHWRSPVQIAGANPAASYQTDSTYTPAAPAICTPDPRWWTQQ